VIVISVSVLPWGANTIVTTLSTSSTWRQVNDYAVDCLGYCAGLMLALFVLDPMSIVWMLAVSALVFVQTVPAGRLRGSAFVARE
jgi:predicted metal-binding membrane protein